MLSITASVGQLCLTDAAAYRGNVASKTISNQLNNNLL